MDISKSSWHYKLVKIYRKEWDIPRNLCGYFWNVIGFTLISPIVLVISIYISLLVLFVLSIPVTGWFIHLDLWFRAFSMIMWMFIAVATLRGYRDTLEFQTKDYREPTILGAWLKAKKTKVCPMLTFK